jgi:hypothetical protein
MHTDHSPTIFAAGRLSRELVKKKKQQDARRSLKEEEQELRPYKFARRTAPSPWI